MIERREVCKKKGFVSVKLAHVALNSIKEKSNRLQVPARVYKCEECDLWHLTKYPKEIFRHRAAETSIDLMVEVKKRLKQLITANSVENLLT